MSIRNLLLSVIVLILIILITAFGFLYLDEHWEDLFGPKAEDFFTLCCVRTSCIDEEYNISPPIPSPICYYLKADFELSAKRDMYSVDLVVKNSSKCDVIKHEPCHIDNLDEGTTIRPYMVVQLDDPFRCGQVNLSISFKDVDNHEKEKTQTEKICPPTPAPTPEPTPKPPGFEAVFAIVGLLAVAYLLRRRK
jgi:PGF-CTERM protein